MAKREFIVKKPFKYAGESYGVRERIILNNTASEQEEARISFGLKWRFIVQLVGGKAATYKDEMAGRNKEKETDVNDTQKGPAEKSEGLVGKVAAGIKHAVSSKGNDVRKGK